MLEIVLLFEVKFHSEHHLSWSHVDRSKSCLPCRITEVNILINIGIGNVHEF